MIKKTLLSTILCLLLGWNVLAQINAGEVMFIGFNADGDDGLAIVSLVDIPANTTLFFTDNEWNGLDIGSGGAFNDTNEGFITWESGAAIISAGTVVSFNEIDNAGNAGFGATVGTISRNGNFNIAGANEVVYLYLGTDRETPTTFLSAIANDEFITPTAVVQGTLDGTGLTAGINATAIDGDEDIGVYNGSLACNSTIADCAALIADPANWITEDGGGDQSNDASAPNFPGDVPTDFGGTALPIELISFRAEVISANAIELYWETVSEIDNDFFTIEKSTDGFNWDEIIEIDGAGTSTELLEYSAIDALPDLGANFYRLKQTDFSGEFEYSDILSIIYQNSNEVDGIITYPNPTADLITVRTTDQNSLSDYHLYNLAGKEVTNLVNVVFQNNSTLKLDLSNLREGLYTFKTNAHLNRIYKQ